MKKLFFALAIAMISTVSAFAQSKVGHINSQKVLDTIPSRKVAIADVMAYEASGVRELREMDSTLQVMYANYQANKDKWTPLVRQSEEQRIQNYQTRLQEREQQIDAVLNKETADINKKYVDMLKQAVKTVSALKKLNYVIDESVTLYSEGGVDITADVIKEIMILDKK